MKKTEEYYKAEELAEKLESKHYDDLSLYKSW
jgi:hypothetical protein